MEEYPFGPEKNQDQGGISWILMQISSSYCAWKQ